MIKYGFGLLVPLGLKISCREVFWNLNWQKPFFTRWSTIMKNIDNYLAFFVQNFDNPSFVKKEGLKLSGMTKEAFEVFSKELDKLFKNRKKNL